MYPTRNNGEWHEKTKDELDEARFNASKALVAHRDGFYNDAIRLARETVIQIELYISMMESQEGGYKAGE